MWLFTPEGFISVVADKEAQNGDRLLARSRNKSHLDAISKYLSTPPFQVEGSDYAWRAWITRPQLISYISSHISLMDYTNFKNQIVDNAYHDACLGVWEEMYLYQNTIKSLK
jgi:hypothetical protein